MTPFELVKSGGNDGGLYHWSNVVHDRNPFTINKRKPNLYIPPYGSKEYEQRIEKASDKILMIYFYGASNYLRNALEKHITISDEGKYRVKITIRDLNKNNMTVYADYLSNLYDMYLNKIENK